jgi:hypothetical protein
MSERQGALPTESTGAQIILNSASRTVEARRRNLRQIDLGGYGCFVWFGPLLSRDADRVPHAGLAGVSGCGLWLGRRSLSDNLKTSMPPWDR